MPDPSAARAPRWLVTVRWLCGWAMGLAMLLPPCARAQPNVDAASAPGAAAHRARAVGRRRARICACRRAARAARRCACRSTWSSASAWARWSAAPTRPAARSSETRARSCAAPTGPASSPTGRRATTWPFRRREEDLLVPSRIEFGVGRAGIVLPPATAGNAVARVGAHPRLLPAGTSDHAGGPSLPLPFRSVASDLLTRRTGRAADTPLFMSMRAVARGARRLRAGAVERAARRRRRAGAQPAGGHRSAMGADIVIAVNVGTPLADESALTSSIGVARQMLLHPDRAERAAFAAGPGAARHR